MIRTRERVYVLTKEGEEKGKNKGEKIELWALAWSHRDYYILFNILEIIWGTREILSPDRHTFI